MTEVPHLLHTVLDDPTDPRSLGAEAHDGEGLATRRNELVIDGVLQGFLHNSWSAMNRARALVPGMSPFPMVPAAFHTRQAVKVPIAEMTIASTLLACTHSMPCRSHAQRTIR